MRWITLALVSLFVCLQSASAQTNLGAVSVGSSTSATYSVEFLNPGTLAAITGTTGGKQNADFTATGDSCHIGSTYAANTLCTVTVKFTPTLAGPRYGSVVLTNASGIPLGELFVSGTGQAPQASFSPAPQVQLLNKQSYYTPNGLATDSAGNAYAVIGFNDPNSGENPTVAQIYKTPGNILVDTSNADIATDATVDGAGNVYVNDFTPGVWILTPSGSYGFAPMLHGFGNADAEGNFYAPCAPGLCKLSLVFGGTYSQSTISSITPSLLFVDGAGDVYASTSSGGTVTLFKFTPSGSQYIETTVATGLAAVNALAADPAGNVYFIDASQNLYKEALQPDASYAKTLLFTGAVTDYTVNWAYGSQPQSQTANRLAVDPAGNVYYWKQTGTSTDKSPDPEGPTTQVPLYGLFEAEYSAPSTLTFPQTTQFSSSAAQTVTITNSGNLPLVFSAVSYPADFRANTPGTGCAAGAILEAGQSCSISAVFQPMTFSGSGSSATLTESLKITTNTGNHTGTTQAITLTGVELPAIATTPTISFSTLSATYQTVSITGDRNETIYYTTNGSTPTTASPKYNGPFPATPGSIIKAFGAEGAYRNSPVVTATAPQPATAAPTFSPNGGTFNYDQQESITDTTAGAKIYYTLDGSLPSTSSTLYNGFLIVDGITTLKAIAVAPGYQPSAVATATFKFVVPNPTISLSSIVFSVTGNYATVTISSPPTEGLFYYTTDGSQPTTSSTPYTAPFKAYLGQTVRVIGAQKGYTSSAVVSATVTDNGTVANPVFSLPSGSTYNTDKALTISDATPGAQISYSIFPVDGSPEIDGSGAAPLTITLTTTARIQAVASEQGFQSSGSVNANYTFQASTPVIAFSGTGNAETFGITTPYPVQAIYYTTNGSQPTTNSARYAGPIPVTSGTKINAIATAAGFVPSNVASAVAP